MEIKLKIRGDLRNSGKAKRIRMMLMVIGIVVLCLFTTTQKASAASLKNPVINSSGTSSVGDCV